MKTLFIALISIAFMAGNNDANQISHQVSSIEKTSLPSLRYADYWIDGDQKCTNCVPIKGQLVGNSSDGMRGLVIFHNSSFHKYGVKYIREIKYGDWSNPQCNDSSGAYEGKGWYITRTGSCSTGRGMGIQEIKRVYVRQYY